MKISRSHVKAASLSLNRAAVKTARRPFGDVTAEDLRRIAGLVTCARISARSLARS